MRLKIHNSLLYIAFCLGLSILTFCFIKSTDLKEYQYFLYWIIGFPMMLGCQKLTKINKYGVYSNIVPSIYIFYAISKTIEPYFLDFNYNWNNVFIKNNSNFSPFIPLKYLLNKFDFAISFSIIINLLFFVYFLAFMIYYIKKNQEDISIMCNGLFSLFAIHAILLLIFPITAPYFNQNGLYSGDTLNIINQNIESIIHMNIFSIGSLTIALSVYISSVIFKNNAIFGCIMIIFSLGVILSQIVLSYVYITDVIISVIAGITAFLAFYNRYEDEY